jgi:MFS family permease
MMIFTAAPFIGPSVGPLIGGFINQNTTWRWTFYVLIIWSAAMLGGIIFFVPETFHPVLLRNKARKLRKDTGEERWKAPLEKVSLNRFLFLQPATYAVTVKQIDSEDDNVFPDSSIPTPTP